MKTIFFITTGQPEPEMYTCLRTTFGEFKINI